MCQYITSINAITYGRVFLLKKIMSLLLGIILAANLCVPVSAEFAETGMRHLVKTYSDEASESSDVAESLDILDPPSTDLDHHHFDDMVSVCYNIISSEKIGGINFTLYYDDNFIFNGSIIALFIVVFCFVV